MVQGGLKKVQGGLEPPLAPHFPRLCDRTQSTNQDRLFNKKIVPGPFFLFLAAPVALMGGEVAFENDAALTEQKYERLPE